MSFIHQLHELLESNFDNPDFDYAELCQQLGYSRSQIYRVFQQKELGSPSTYLRQFRLEKGKALLDTTDLAIQFIAFDVGFKSISHFSKVFYDTYGIYPQAYRKKK